MGNHDAQNLKSEADILARQSRPQRSSTWVPKTRDWRYATGVIQHDDFQDAPKSRSVWDTLDYDYQATSDENNQQGSLSRSRSGTNNDLGVTETMNNLHTPKRAISKVSTESPKVVVQAKAPYKSMELRKRIWAQVIKFTRSEDTTVEDGEGSYEPTGLIVRFQFTRKNKAHVREILERTVSLLLTPCSLDLTRSPGPNRILTPPVSSTNTPASARTAETIRAPHILDSIESIYTFPLFQRTWVDETYDFNVKTVRATLRHADAEVDDLGSNYEWYSEAVPADAIFPPGVPVSAKEINAFYPHHVRWKGVMMRLTNNDYRGADIMGMQAHFRGAPSYHTPPVYMNNYQRDTVKSTISGFKTASYKGKSDRNLRVDHLAPGPYIESMRKGFTLPTFEDLLRGLQRLPSGLDARGLTQCLSWYLSIRNTFTPKLELNVLHTQSLIRALREPLKPFGPQNLDRNALQEWRNKGTFEVLEIEGKKQGHKGTPVEADQQHRTQLHLNLDEDDVLMNLTFPIRHVLTFPFLALHGVIGEALKVGIEKAQLRQATRKEDETKRDLEGRWAGKATGEDDIEVVGVVQQDEVDQDNIPVQAVTEEAKRPYRIPKRPRPAEKDALPAPKKAHIATGARKLAPAAARSHVPSYPQGVAHLGRSWHASAPSSTYRPSQLGQDSIYGRRDIQARQPYGGARQNGRPNHGRQYPPVFGNGHNGDGYGR